MNGASGHDSTCAVSLQRSRTAQYLVGNENNIKIRIVFIHDSTMEGHTGPGIT